MPLHIIQTLADPLLNLLADDPVRPEIPAEFRVSETTEIFVLQHEQTLEPEAVVCVAYRSKIPGDVLELAAEPDEDTHVAVFYTIWSYKPGAGRKLIQQARTWINRNRKNITEFVTLSPPTDMARIFHLRNGAEVFRINPETVNYLYP
jgi:hypothetical protein